MAKFIMLCGLPGSGKSTYAKSLIEFKNNISYLSSDKIREELWGDENVQGDPNKVFSLMLNRCIDNLKAGIDVIYDATNVKRKNRVSTINSIKKYADKIECHIVWAPIDICVQRDSMRNRTVGADVIMRIARSFDAPYYDEGFSDIKIIKDHDFDINEYTDKCDKSLHIPHDNPNHSLDIFTHCVKSANYLFKLRAKLDLITAARWHDIGKSKTKSFVNSKGIVTDIAHYYNHDNVGAWMSYGIKDMSLYASWLISTHMQPYFNSKYYKNLPDILKKDIDLLHEADIKGH